MREPEERGGGVQPVEDTQLQQLPWRDVVDDQDADVVEWWHRGRPVALDHPLRERFGSYRPGVLDARVRRDLGAEIVIGGRYEPVDHAAREAHVLLDPRGE